MKVHILRNIWAAQISIKELKIGHKFGCVQMEGVSCMNDSEIKYYWNMLHKMLEAFLKTGKNKGSWIWAWAQFSNKSFSMVSACLLSSLH